MKVKLKIYTWWGLLIIWMSLIFILSHQTSGSSGALSSNFTQFFIRIFGFLNLDISTFNLHFWVRKTAHFSAYFILGILSYQAFNHTINKHATFYALIISVLFAISDEYHQTFIPGRSGEFRDVLIDSGGACLGVICMITIKTFTKKKQAI